MSIQFLNSVTFEETQATSSQDKFAVLESGVLKYRTAAEVRSDIGAGTGDITSVSAGTNLTGGGTSGAVTLNMATGGVGAGTYGSTSDSTKIDTITVDAYGRVTAVATGGTGSGQMTSFTISDGTNTDTIANGNTMQFNGQNGLTATVSPTPTTDYVRFSLDNTGPGAGTYGSTSDDIKIDTITLDAQGRVTAIATGTTGDITGVTAGTGLSGGGTSGGVTLNLDLGELGTGGTLVGTDYLIAENGGVDNRQLISSIPLSIFNNNAGFVTTSGFTMNSGAQIKTYQNTYSGSSQNAATLITESNIGIGGTINWWSEVQNGSFGTYNHAVFYHGSTQAGSIRRSGNTTVSYNTSSDYRLKENVTEITDGIERVKQLKPSKFNFIGEERIVDGFLAHEVQNVVPESISGEKDELDNEGNPVYQAIDQSKIVPLLAAALKEAIGKIEDLETRIQTLEGI